MTERSLRNEVLKTVDTAKHVVADGLSDGYKAVKSEADYLANKAAHTAHDAADALEKGMKNANDEADIIVEAARQQGVALQKLVAGELRTHPLRTLGIAAAVGLVVGYMTSR